MEQQTTKERLEKNVKDLIISLIIYLFIITAMFLPIIFISGGKIHPLLLVLVYGFGIIFQFRTGVMKRRKIISGNADNATILKEMGMIVSLPLIIKGVKYGIMGMFALWILWIVTFGVIFVLGKIFLDLLAIPVVYFLNGMVVLIILLLLLSVYMTIKRKENK